MTLNWRKVDSGIRKKLFIKRVVKNWQRLPRDIDKIDILSHHWEHSELWANSSSWRRLLPCHSGDQSRWPQKVTSNPNYSINLGNFSLDNTGSDSSSLISYLCRGTPGQCFTTLLESNLLLMVKRRMIWCLFQNMAKAREDAVCRLSNLKNLLLILKSLPRIYFPSIRSFSYRVLQY